MRALMAGSEIRESHRDDDTACRTPIASAATRRCRRLPRPAAPGRRGRWRSRPTPSPTTRWSSAETGEIVSGGNFHAEPVAFAADQIALALAEIGAIAQRRVALMVDPALSFDLPPFLTPAPGLNSGFMIAEVTSAALMSENKHLANPCSTDSTPTSAQPGRPCQHGRPWRAPAAPMTENLFRHRRHRGCLRRAGRRTAQPLVTIGPAASPRHRPPPRGCCRGRTTATWRPISRPRCARAFRRARRTGHDLLPEVFCMTPWRSTRAIARSCSVCLTPAPMFRTISPQSQRHRGRRWRDTDWHIDRLYDGLMPRARPRVRDLPPLRHRRQPRSVRRQPLSRPEHDRAGARSPFRRQHPHLEDGAEPDADEIAAAPGLARALSCGARGRTRAGARHPRRRHPL
jgi:hypothetical protein